MVDPNEKMVNMFGRKIKSPDVLSDSDGNTNFFRSKCKNYTSAHPVIM